MLDEDDYHLVALAGLRYYRLDNELKLTGAALPTKKIDHVEDWVDPMIGLQGRLRLAPNWYVSARVTTAIAGDSDSAYGLFGGIGYVFNKSLSTVAGYRYMKLDYENGDFLFDVEMSGPTVGLAFYW
jgi:predicted porin